MTTSATVLQKPQHKTLQSVLSAMKNPYEKYYPKYWPKNPFHEGEVKLQKQAGVQDSVMSYAPRVVRPYMPEQHVDFYQAQPFLVAAARDTQGSMWATLLTSPTGQADMTTSPDLATLEIAGGPTTHDALAGTLEDGTDLGLLGIEFATKRRNRVNGRITRVSQSSNQDATPVLTFSVDQSFGNCPQYIVPRKWWSAQPEQGTEDSMTPQANETRNICRPSELSQEQIELISQTKTILVATGYRGEGEDPRYGNDASHRGGPAGFLIVKDSKTLVLPEFAGNNHFNSLGNIQLDSRMGITIPSFEDGGMLQISGTAQVDMDLEKAANTYPGALRVTTFHIEQVNEVPAGSIPVRWSVQEEAASRQIQVAGIVKESANVKSFHLQPLPQDTQTLWDFTSGQHLPIQLRTPSGELLRTYSLSGSPSNNAEYRISVKRENLGKASSYLHDHVKVGDILQVNRPAGDFVLPKIEEAAAPERPLILLSSGIGVTPILSMLHQYTDGLQAKTRRREVFWVHGARDSNHHPFRGEVEGLMKERNGSVVSHVVYSKPLPTDSSHDSEGHINLDLLENLVSNLESADVYMCGNAAFMVEMEDALHLAGVDPKRIFFETF